MTRPESDTSLERAFAALVAHRHASEAENNTPNSVTMCEKAETPDDATNATTENGLSQTGSSTLGSGSANQDRFVSGDVSLDTPTPQIPRPVAEPSQAPTGAGPALVPVGNAEKPVSPQQKPSGDIVSPLIPLISPVSPLPAKRAFGVQHKTENLRKTRVILSGRAWEWWWWESVSGNKKKRRRTRYGGMFHKLSSERKATYERNRAIYWKRKLAAEHRREVNEFKRSA